MSDQNPPIVPYGLGMNTYQQGYTCGICHAWVVPGIGTHVCVILQPAVPTTDWRCTCMALVLPGEEHRCFYRDILNVLERIATQLEKR